MSNNVDTPVLIVGAGPAGLVLALALVQNGVKVRVIDKEAFYRPGQRGAGIQPRTLEIFNYLGVLDDIVAKGIDAPKLRRVYKLPGGVEPLKTVNMLQYDEPTPSTPIIAHRSATLRKANGVHIGQENSEAILRAHLANIGTNGAYDDRILHVRPTETPHCFYVALGGQIDHKKLESDREEFIKAIYAATDRHDLQFGELRWISEWRPNIRMVNKFREGRGFVAGGGSLPDGGQGLNSSVQDSFNLAWKLALVEKDLASPDLLDTYTEERLPVIAAMLQASTTLLNALQTSKSGGTDNAAWTREGLLKMLGINYRWSSIVVDERTEKPKEPTDVYGGETSGDLRAGDRAPDAPGLVPVLGDQQHTLSLFHIFRPVHHTVLLFASDATIPASSLKIVVVYPRGTKNATPVIDADFTVVDKEGHAYSTYGASPACPATVIIRPDTVVGAIVFGVDGLKKYLNAVFSAV
ncbi:uncharacterized protein B0H18DRAFT_1120636 [Fomitopsis serialis]|uniref:uncharacterized protein n=1 Tax=Fomitopsis serialis TaxID=139415 RepID=UPI002007D6DE|nr:uncharacterized protein B0H18DRAFT_1120636 [Neoantrodia serialis]KAH9922913.1 hypothetical protein B0H18DRAFT_1120636 [Neoantrodia serialis]